MQPLHTWLSGRVRTAMIALQELHRSRSRLGSALRIASGLLTVAPCARGAPQPDARHLQGLCLDKGYDYDEVRERARTGPPESYESSLQIV